MLWEASGVDLFVYQLRHRARQLNVDSGIYASETTIVVHESVLERVADAPVSIEKTVKCKGGAWNLAHLLLAKFTEKLHDRLRKK